MSESKTIELGDVVRLNSEEYNFMTVASIYQTLATCVFFNKDGHFQSIEVPIIALKKSELN